MIAAVAEPSSTPTLWGFDPCGLHDRFWAARGVQVVRLGEPSAIIDRAELYLLTDPRTLVMFRLRPLLDLLSWAKPEVLFVRLRFAAADAFREEVHVDDEGFLERFERSYKNIDMRLARVALVRDHDLARRWQAAVDPRSAWRALRRESRDRRRETCVVQGRAFDRSCDVEMNQFVHELIGFWKHPAATIPDLVHVGNGVWTARGDHVDPSVCFVGPAWIGAGRNVKDTAGVLGPAALWDVPAVTPRIEQIRWDQIEPAPAPIEPPNLGEIKLRPRSALGSAAKRAFDIIFALVMLCLSLPLFPLVMLAIWLEDGRPFFFAHYRETRGGREFPCLKFRSMRKDADRIKQALAKANQADGPQFFIRDDPRLTRVGRIIRKLNIDELPQFFNVLLGHMSVVGPRPSPYAENQFCPPWREARLSVRPGVTGLWQVMRTRREGEDFQEWIRYDIEYVEQGGWRMDLKILWKTAWMIATGGRSRS